MDLVAAAEEPDRSEVDPVVTRLDHRVVHAIGVWDAGMDADGELERAPADGCVGDGDGHVRAPLLYIAVPTSTAVQGGDGVVGGGGRGRLAAEAGSERLDLVDECPA